MKLFKAIIIESAGFSGIGGTLAAIGQFIRNVLTQSPEQDAHQILMAFLTGAAGALSVLAVKGLVFLINKRFKRETK